jgi:molecular chaperone DnaK (HSP70)
VWALLSYHSFTNSERLIGDTAKSQVAMNPINQGAPPSRSAEEKTTGQKNKITITNDKGRLSKEEIENHMLLSPS